MVTGEPVRLLYETLSSIPDVWPQKFSIGVFSQEILSASKEFGNSRGYIFTSVPLRARQTVGLLPNSIGVIVPSDYERNPIGLRLHLHLCKYPALNIFTKYSISKIAIGLEILKMGVIILYQTYILKTPYRSGLTRYDQSTYVYISLATCM